jgi:hypothetical protein
MAYDEDREEHAAIDLTHGPFAGFVIDSLCGASGREVSTEASKERQRQAMLRKVLRFLRRVNLDDHSLNRIHNLY